MAFVSKSSEAKYTEGAERSLLLGLGGFLCQVKPILVFPLSFSMGIH